MEIEQENRKLYGGAIQVTLPNCFIDISNKVPVPDNQEVFNFEDINVVFEILEYSDIPDKQAVEYLFRDLAEQNETKELVILSQQEIESLQCTQLQTELPRFQIIGQQMVSPDKRAQMEGKKDLVQI